MRHVFVPFVLALVAAPAAQSPVAGPGRSVRDLIEVVVSGPLQMQQLLAMDLDLAGCRAPLLAQRRIEVVGFPGDFARLQQAGFRCRRLVPDLEAAHAAAVAPYVGVGADTLTPPIGQGAMGGHYTLAQMEAILDAFHQQYPNLCSARVSIGQSVEGRDLWMVKISDNVGVDENEPEVFFEATHHAREPLSMGATLLFMDELLDGYGSDPEATFLIDERELWFVPCINPDGYVHNEQTNPNGGGMWRKNRRDNLDGTFGVDLNRNYATAWSAPNGGSSASTNSETYRGPGPFSEPETTAIEAFSQSRQFVQVFSTHTYTDVLLRPWGWQSGDPANVAAYDVLGAFMVRENGIAHGSISGLLYTAAGSAVDHHHTVRGSYAWTAELGRANEGGFWPVGPTIEAIARRHQRMFRKVALTAGAAFDRTDVVVAEAAGGNGNGIVEPGEAGEVVVTVRNVGMAPAPLTIELRTADPQLALGTNLVSLGALPAFTSTDNAAQPLSFAVPPGFAGAIAELELRLSGDGRVQDLPLDVLLVSPRTCVDDDFELDRGFTRAVGGTATTGLWQREAPQATQSGGVPIQPGTQTTPGGAACWVTEGTAGASAGANDVDGGYTDLLSPTMDLSHLAAARVAFDHWYAESVGDDALVVELSRDGGQSWESLYSTTASTGAWQRLELPLGAPLTSQMVLRVRAQDLAPSLVEACVDGFEVLAAAEDGAVTLLGSGVLGTSVRVGLSGPDGGIVVPFGALGLGPGLVAPGVGGTFLLDPASVALLSPAPIGGSGYAAFDLALPVQAGLIGVTVAFQSLVVDAAGLAFGGNAATVVLQ